MRFVCAVAGAALFACNLAGIAESKVSCDQTLTAPLRSNAVLAIDSRPAGLEIVGTDQRRSTSLAMEATTKTLHPISSFNSLPAPTVAT